MIIGITGHKRHGKDTCGNFIKELLHSNNVKLCSFASPMKRVCTEIFGWDKEYIEQHKEEIDPDYGISPRQFLQVFGSEFAQFYLSDKFPEFNKTTGRSLWVKRLLKGLNDTDINIITDIRFKHEIDGIRNSGQDNIIIKVVRSAWPTDVTHLSELEVDEINPDVALFNDGSLGDFKKEIYEHLKTIYATLNIHKRIYISGPITGKEEYNRKAFEKASNYLQAIRYMVVTPFDVTTPRDDFTWEDYMKLDIKGMVDCDAIYLLNGWEESKGANIEKRLAEELGLSVYYQSKEDM